MPAFSSPHRRSVIVSRLRAAGCVFAEEEARLLISAARTRDDLAIMVDRRAAGLPLEHVLGWAEFCGLRIVVDPGVFVPRRRTEFLVRQAAALARQAVSPASQVLAGSRVVVVDLCCGSGAVGVALVAALDGVELYAVDIDPAAVRCARRCRWSGYERDLYEPLPAALRGRVDVLVANAPYVPTEAVGLLPAEAHTRDPGGARRWWGRARRPAAGGRRGATMAGAGRLPAGRDERGPSASDRRNPRPQRADPARGHVKRRERHRRHRNQGAPAGWNGRLALSFEGVSSDGHGSSGFESPPFS